MTMMTTTTTAAGPCCVHRLLSPAETLALSREFGLDDGVFANLLGDGRLDFAVAALRRGIARTPSGGFLPDEGDVVLFAFRILEPLAMAAVG